MHPHHPLRADMRRADIGRQGGLVPYDIPTHFVPPPVGEDCASRGPNGGCPANQTCKVVGGKATCITLGATCVSRGPNGGCPANQTCKDIDGHATCVGKGPSVAALQQACAVEASAVQTGCSLLCGTDDAAAKSFCKICSEDYSATCKGASVAGLTQACETLAAAVQAGCNLICAQTGGGDAAVKQCQVGICAKNFGTACLKEK